MILIDKFLFFTFTRKKICYIFILELLHSSKRFKCITQKKKIFTFFNLFVERSHIPKDAYNFNDKLNLLKPKKRV